MEDDTMLVDLKEAARQLGVAPKTVWRWAQSGFGPELVHIGRPDAKKRTLRMRRAELDQFISGGTNG